MRTKEGNKNKSEKGRIKERRYRRKKERKVNDTEMYIASAGVWLLNQRVSEYDMSYMNVVKEHARQGPILTRYLKTRVETEKKKTGRATDVEVSETLIAMMRCSISSFFAITEALPKFGRAKKHWFRRR
jgi:hypothetical protein